MSGRKLLCTTFLMVVVNIAFTSLIHSQTKIEGDESDYVTLFRSFYYQSPQQGSFYQDEGTLGVSITGFSSVVENEYYRVILQFDISELTAPVTQAVFNVYKLQTFGDDFDIELHGSSQNRDEFIEVSETSSADEDEFFATNGYSKLGGTDPFIEFSDPDYEWYSIDITNFINNRITEYQSGGTDSIVVLKLQPDGTYSGSTLDTRYNFATGDSDMEPYLAIYQDNAQQTVSGNEGWRMLSSPMQSNRFDDITDAFWTQGFTGADVDSGTSNVYYWNEGDGSQDTTSRGFTSVSDNSQTLRTGQGFIAYVYEDDNPDAAGIDGGFPKTLDVDGIANSGSVSLPVQLTSQGGVYESAYDGWNLVGNPYNSAIDWDAAGWTKTNIDNSIYVWSESAGNYLTWNGMSGTLTGGEISQFQGFWVKANAASPILTVDETAQTSGAVFYKQDTNIPEIKFSIHDENSLSSETILMLSEEGKVGKDRLDAFKLKPLRDQYLSLYTIVNNNSPMDIQALPSDLQEDVTMAMGVEGTNLNGEYVLSWNRNHIPSDWKFILHDHKTGKKISLDEASEYKFEVTGSSRQKNQQNLNPSGLVLKPDLIKAKANPEPRFSINIISGSYVSVESSGNNPSEFTLKQNYPNPFNPTTNIQYSVTEAGPVKLTIYNVMGQKVATLVSETKSPGTYRVSWDAVNMASGIYHYRLQAAGQVLTRQMTLIK